MTKTFEETIQIVDARSDSLRILLEDAGMIVVKGAIDNSVATVRPGNIQLNGSNGQVRLIVNSKGILSLRDDAGRTVFLLDPEGNDSPRGGATLTLSRSPRSGAAIPVIWINGNTGDMRLGGGGVDGDIFLLPAGAANDDMAQARIHLDGENANITLGARGEEGNLFLTDGQGNRTILLNGHLGNIDLGGNDVAGNVIVKNTAGNTTVNISGEEGDIILHNADCAEDFEVVDFDNVEPGTVMVIDEDGKLRKSRKAYDRAVAGVISGAGGYRPGIILGRGPSRGNTVPIALAGRVSCLVDGGHSPIAVGDLLTTSDRSGFAMKATDADRAFGAVIGKALQSWTGGPGLIPILVSLQ